MLKTIKGKLAFIYSTLIALILIVGMLSVYNIENINLLLQKIMSENYQSIVFVRNMVDAIEKQNMDIMTYLLGVDQEERIKKYNINKKVFLENYYLEKKNITEEQELYYTDVLLKSYDEYVKQFEEIQSKYNTADYIDGKDDYIDKLEKSYNEIEEILEAIILINEDALFYKKKLTAEEAIKAKRIISIATGISALIGYIIASIVEKKMLASIFVLNKKIKNTRIGNIGEQIDEKSNDELGQVIYEFNKMSRRLEEFEKSTLGKVMKEKNKSISIIKSISDPVLVLDEQFRIIMVNDISESFFGIKEERVIRRKVSEVIKELSLNKLISEIRNNKIIKQSDKVIHLVKADKPYFFEISINCIKSDMEIAEGYIIVLKDISELKAIEQGKDEFLATITHEIKTPITSIMIGIDLIANEKIGQLNKNQRKILSDINLDGERLNELVNNLLNISKLKSSSILLNYSMCDVEELIRTSITTLSQLARDKNIIVDYGIEDSMPLVKADFEKVTWVINNLLSNAIKNCSQWDVITLRAFIKNQMVAITVTDTGKGIPKEMLEKIFDRHVQVDYKIDSYNGEGLGLSIAKGIVNIHKGEIWCESEEGFGSTFTFTLPLN